MIPCSFHACSTLDFCRTRCAHRSSPGTAGFEDVCDDDLDPATESEHKAGSESMVDVLARGVFGLPVNI